MGQATCWSCQNRHVLTWASCHRSRNEFLHKHTWSTGKCRYRTASIVEGNLRRGCTRQFAKLLFQDFNVEQLSNRLNSCEVWILWLLPSQLKQCASKLQADWPNDGLSNCTVDISNIEKVSAIIEYSHSLVTQSHWSIMRACLGPRSSRRPPAKIMPFWSRSQADGLGHQSGAKGRHSALLRLRVTAQDFLYACLVPFNIYKTLPLYVYSLFHCSFLGLPPKKYNLALLLANKDLWSPKILKTSC